MTAQAQLAADLAQIQVTDAERIRLSTCLLDFTAAVLVGAKTPLGRALVDRYAWERERGYAFTLAYLAEISEFSHGHTRMAGHLGSTPLPTVLALAARDGASDCDWDAAALTGYEAFARVGRSLMPALEQWGSLSTGVSGSFGAAAAAARVLGMDATRLSATLGVAAYLTPLTPMDAYLSGANSAEAATATATGILAAELVSLGAYGSPRILDEFHERVVGNPPNPAFVGDGTDRLAIHELYFKPYPCCRFTHGAIQATLALMSTGVTSADIEKMVVQTTPRAVRVCGDVPQSSQLGYIERQFSTPYLVGLALLQKHVTAHEVFAPSADQDHAVVDFARQHVVVEEESSLIQYGTVSPTILQVRLRDGTDIEQRVLRPWGCLEEPMTEGDIETKFLKTAHSLLGSATADDWKKLAQGLAWSELGKRLRVYLSQENKPNA